ncbi:MAG: hypothetical protein M3R64_11295 [Pseudomonadota bacterium]|nr:hypothetical protein [Pseudomonadota bacterium]
MYFDSSAWPPPPDGFDPEPEPARALGAAQERTIMRLIGVVLCALFLGPFAGSSLIDAVVALARAVNVALG